MLFIILFIVTLGHGEYPDKMDLVMKELGIRIIEKVSQSALPTVKSDNTLSVPPDKVNIIDQ